MKLNLKSKLLLSNVESRIDSADCFFLLANQSSGEVRIVDTLTDFGDAVYLEIGRGEKQDLMSRVESFLSVNTFSINSVSESF